MGYPVKLYSVDPSYVKDSRFDIIKDSTFIQETMDVVETAQGADFLGSVHLVRFFFDPLRKALGEKFGSKGATRQMLFENACVNFTYESLVKLTGDSAIDLMLEIVKTLSISRNGELATFGRMMLVKYERLKKGL